MLGSGEADVRTLRVSLCIATAALDAGYPSLGKTGISLKQGREQATQKAPQQQQQHTKKDKKNKGKMRWIDSRWVPKPDSTLGRKRLGYGNDRVRRSQQRSPL